MKIAGNEVKSIEILEVEKIGSFSEDYLKKIQYSHQILQFIKVNKWISIPNKNLCFNKEVMACYPDINNNFQEICCNTPCKAKEVLELINSNEEYSKYKIKWDIPTPRENQLTLYRQGYPWKNKKKDSKICGWDVLICKKLRGEIKAYCNGGVVVEDKGLVLPIFRLGREKDHEEFNKGKYKFDYPLETVLLLLCLNDLIPDFKDEILNLKYKEFYEQIQQYKKYITDYNINNNKEIEVQVLKKDDLTNELLTKGTGDTGKSGLLKFTLKNEEILKIKFSDGKIISDGEYTYKNGDIEIGGFKKREDGDLIKAGDSIIYKVNGDVERLNYKDGVPEGESEYIYKNGDKEMRNYIHGILDKDVKFYPKGENDVKICRVVDGEKKDVTLLNEVLNIDKIRVNMNSYDENILIDPNRGHWDISEEEVNELENILQKKVYIRDPKEDIKVGGIVGIDFGTKSTVVVFQDDRNQTYPMRISGGNLMLEAKESDYENPTVIEFRDVESFMKDYKEKDGRPLTKWEDVTVSHTAFQNMVNGTSDDFNSFISELKQWAGLKNQKLLVRDKVGVEKILPPYMEVENGELDPIELYAYYIGSYINNMTNGIYMEYFLSFPVTYEKAVREKILQSFERGIKKSLPESLSKDETAMKKFKVRHGANEPAAYAVCALQEYGFEPDDDESVYYGVFDFGGGTADFDFGVWKASENERRFDYELIHFGAGGDRYLGGENILKELAYEVLKDNQDLIRKEKLSFARPEWCDRFIGDEGVVNNSSGARLNIKVLMEKLRPLWENSSVEQAGDNVIKVNLYSKNGDLKTGVEISIDREKVDSIIESKIDRGIENFFIALKKAMNDEPVEKVNILLAGNSCKHPKVMELFEKHIEDFDGEVEIFPALGTEEAYAKMEERGIEIDPEDRTNPTGKTGVAYGIIDSRAGGRIDVKNRDEEANIANEINFKYYVGYEGRKKFRVVLGPQTEYEQFIYYLDTTADVFDLYYSSLPEAMESKMPIAKAMRKRIELDKEYPEAKIYIKAVTPDTLKYVVTDKDIEEKEYLEEGEIKLD